MEPKGSLLYSQEPSTSPFPVALISIDDGPKPYDLYILCQNIKDLQKRAYFLDSIYIITTSIAMRKSGWTTWPVAITPFQNHRLYFVQTEIG
jgi:hypothetical protein